MRGCVLAGVWGAGKTTVYQRLLAKLLGSDCQSLLALPQAATITTHTYTHCSLTDQTTAIVAWLDELTAFLEDMDRRFCVSGLADHRFAPHWEPTAVLECLAFDVPVYKLPAPRGELLHHEKRLADLGLHLIVLRVPEAHVRAQCVESTRRHRSPKWGRYLDEFGRNDQERTEYVCHAQRRLMSWANESPMTCTVIDTSGGDWDDYADRIAGIILARFRTKHVQHQQNSPTDANDPSSR